MSLISVDIEISDVFQLAPGEDLDKYAPFNVCVAATAMDGGEEKLWFSRDGDGKPSDRISVETARALLAYMELQISHGHALCAWNGLSFDLKWIGHTADDLGAAGRVAMQLFDPMFQFFNQRGFPVGLAAVAGAMGIKTKKLMSGADAPKEWQAGNFDAVFEYVMGDARMTNLVAEAVQRERQVRWITKKGDEKFESMARLKRVHEVLCDPEPDQSWMDRPMRRGKFFEWIPTEPKAL